MVPSAAQDSQQAGILAGRVKIKNAVISSEAGNPSITGLRPRRDSSLRSGGQAKTIIPLSDALSSNDAVLAARR
jgi:hypothetical protein